VPDLRLEPQLALRVALLRAAGAIVQLA